MDNFPEFGQVTRRIQVPTGHILIMQGERGSLELLSLGDYGKEKNVKAAFMGLDRDIEGVPNGEIMPLEEKWVITISTQYGCSMGCKFCDVPMVGTGRNATIADLLAQVKCGLTQHPEINRTKRLNIHFARMGEPTWNWAVIEAARELQWYVRDHLNSSLIHPVVSTMMPRGNDHLFSFLNSWVWTKNHFYEGDAGLQLSINSTNEDQRREMFNGNALTLQEISSMFERLPWPVGRKYALNFALADGYEVNGEKLRTLFDPRHFMVKITPMHVTRRCVENNINTSGGYETYAPYKLAEECLRAVGFDVLVFIPSMDEDRGRITCGNAILSGTMPECEFTEEQ